VKVTVAMRPPLSVTMSRTAAVPAAVGVPDTMPAGLMPSPGGRVALGSAQVYVLEPPVAVSVSAAIAVPAVEVWLPGACAVTGARTVHVRETFTVLPALASVTSSSTGLAVTAAEGVPDTTPAGLIPSPGGRDVVGSVQT